MIEAPNGAYVVDEITLDMLLAPDFVTGFSKDGTPTTVKIGSSWYYRADTIGADSSGDPQDNIEAAANAIQHMKRHNIEVKGWKLSHIAKAIAHKVAREMPPFFATRTEVDILSHSFGGRSQVFVEFGSCDAVEYDMPMAYPLALAQCCPTRPPFPVAVDSPVRPGVLEYWDCLVKIRNSSYGALPVRLSDMSVDYPRNGVMRGTWLLDEIEAAVANDHVRIVKTYSRYRMRSRELPWIANVLFSCDGATRKCIKTGFVRAIGLLAYKGGGGHRIIRLKDGEKSQANDVPIAPLHGIFSRKVKPKDDAEEAKPPWWYRPLISQTVWAKVRANMIESLSDTIWPLSVHVDGILAKRQDEEPRHMRLKTEYGLVQYECPWKGALFINGEPIKTPGRTKPDE